MSENTVADVNNILPKLGDRLYKENKISDTILYSQESLDRLSRAWLREFIKNTSKISVNVMFAPYLHVGDTVSVTDVSQGISNELYFVDSVKDSTGNYELVLAKYPG